MTASVVSVGLGSLLVRSLALGVFGSRSFPVPSYGGCSFVVGGVPVGPFLGSVRSMSR